MEEYIVYKHHKENVYVKKDLKGKHREHCLCHNCSLFYPEDRDINCPIARANYANCVEFNLVLPVWECPYFRPKEMSRVTVEAEEKEDE